MFLQLLHLPNIEIRNTLYSFTIDILIMNYEHICISGDPSFFCEGYYFLWNPCWLIIYSQNKKQITPLIERKRCMHQFNLGAEKVQIMTRYY